MPGELESGTVESGGFQQEQQDKRQQFLASMPYVAFVNRGVWMREPQDEADEKILNYYTFEPIRKAVELQTGPAQLVHTHAGEDLVVLIKKSAGCIDKGNLVRPDYFSEIGKTLLNEGEMYEFNRLDLEVKTERMDHARSKEIIGSVGKFMKSEGLGEMRGGYCLSVEDYLHDGPDFRPKGSGERTLYCNGHEKSHVAGYVWTGNHIPKILEMAYVLRTATDHARAGFASYKLDFVQHNPNK